MKKFLFIVLFLFSCTNNINVVDELEIDVAKPNNCPVSNLVFMQHGLAANKNHDVIKVAKEEFLKNCYTVVTFNSRHSLGKYNRDVENTRLSTFKEDLADVIKWASQQKFYREPFAVVGHSLGGASVLSYANENPKRVGLVVAIAPVVSGNLWEKACFENMADFCKKWKNDSEYLYEDPETKEKVHIAYKTLEGAKKYDANEFADKLKPTVLLIGGEKDYIVPTKYISDLFSKIKSNKKLSVINDSSHNFTDTQNKEDLAKEISFFLRKN